MWLPFESKPGFGLHDGQQVSNMQVAVELCLLFSRQSSSLRPLRQLQHSLPVAFAEIDRQQELGPEGQATTRFRECVVDPRGHRSVG